MTERQQLAWLARRVGFGLAPGQLEAWEELGVDAVIQQLVSGDANGVEPARDPFGPEEDFARAPARELAETIGAWFSHFVTTPRPFEAWMAFFWHDYFAVSARVVDDPAAMRNHVRLLHDHALGEFRDLLREVTTDAAMLVFLDGTTNTGASPNENYGRELLELYSVGVDSYTEEDVRAASIALTGWRVFERLRLVRFVPARHDDSPQRLLGVSGVHDVETVVDAVVGHPATAARVTDLLGGAILGPDADRVVVERGAAAFAEHLDIRRLARYLLKAAVDGAAQPAIIEPVPWLASVIRATETAAPVRQLGALLIATGQVPMLPPNVGGFPPPMSYLSTAATIARINVAAVVADFTPASNPVRRAAEDRDLGGLARLLGLVDGFTEQTEQALGATRGRDLLAAALACPELVVTAGAS